MDVIQHFDVLGIGTDVLVTSESTRDEFSMCLFDCQPGDGPPPHRHAFGDEVFMVVSGQFEVFDGSGWNPIPAGHFVPALRNRVHTFRNSGTAAGKLLSVSISGHHDLFLEEISRLAMPQDARLLMEISERYGISYPRPEDDGPSSYSTVLMEQTTKSRKLLAVLGQDVEIVVSSEDTDNGLMVLTQTSAPGEGVPIHTHLFEDEIFSIMEGEYEVFDGNAWVKLSKGAVWYSLRGRPHGFRNCGQTEAKIHALAVPGTELESLLEGVSGLRAPDDLAQFMEISRKHGVTFES